MKPEQADLGIPKLRRPKTRETDVSSGIRNALQMHRLGIFVNLDQAKTDEAKAALIRNAGILADEHVKRRGTPVWIFWRQNTGGAKLPGRGGRMQVVRFALPGSADLTGVIYPTGRWCNLEIKKPGGRVSPHQKALSNLATAAGAVFGVADNAVAAVDFIHKAIQTEKTRLNPAM